MAQHTSTLKATINDVARAAAVSRQTVSNALNNPDRVRPDTLERVRRAITELDYHPNSAARSMRAQRAGALGIEINPDPDAGSDVAHPLLVRLVVHSARYDVHLVPFADTTTFPDLDGYRDMVRRRLVDAFIFADTHEGDPRPAWLTDEGIPFATFGRIYGRPEHTSWADVDSHEGTRLATDHLVTRGYRTIGYLGWPVDLAGADVAHNRRLGWRDALTSAGITLGPEAAAAQDLSAATLAAEALLDQLECGDAIVCSSDLLALGVLQAVLKRGLRPGLDIGVTGFDGSLIARRHCLTTVEQPLAQLADVLLSFLSDQLAGRAAPREGVLLTPTLQTAASTSPN